MDMEQGRRPFVLFSAAAGPRQGFGHLVRCGVIARMLGVPHALLLRGTDAAVRRARELGWTVADEWPDDALPKPSLVVVDDPSARHAERRVRSARAAGVPLATIHDLGLSHVESDLSVDGSVRPGRGASRAELSGPRFAILDPSLASLRRERRRRRERHVLIALGGGAHVLSIGVKLVTAISREVPGITIDVATGFTTCQRWPILPAGAKWIHQPEGLGEALAMASVAVTAGGLTIYEACALGTPIVGFPVTAAQRQTTAAIAARGAAIDAGASTRALALRRAARAVAGLFASPARARAIGARARTLVDGLGAVRVTIKLQRLGHLEPRGGRRHAA
jgi:spore coat polysaccharide biosynthesis predicted glycosyltransferase SpsG